MNIPSSVKVGGVNYAIVETNETICLNGNECRGLINYEDSTITISSRSGKQIQKITFLHELLHAIFYERDLPLENEEEVVTKMAKTLHQIFIDNGVEFNK